jgi:protein-S-isoprenylcysteine O-methyltransferase Ste14
MDALRYALALALLCTVPPMLFYWPVIHPFIRFWRRLGPALTYLVILGAAAVVGVELFRLRASLLAVEFGTNWPLVAAGVLCFASAARLRVLLHRTITNKLLSGLPELEPERHPQRLVRTGLYARVRHPRYLQFTLALFGYALFANYLAGYVIWLIWLPAMYAVALLEERELRERFGEDYENYSLEVPRFLPRIRPRSTSASRSGGDPDRA